MTPFDTQALSRADTASATVADVLAAWSRTDVAGRAAFARDFATVCLDVASRRQGGLNLARALAVLHPLALRTLAAIGGAPTTDSMVRDTAQITFRGLPLAHLPTLFLLLDDPDPIVRGGAVAGVAEAGGAGADLTPVLDRVEALAHDPSLPASGAWMTGWVLARWALTHPGDPSALDRLARVLGGGALDPCGALSALARAPTPVAAALRGPLEVLTRHKRGKVAEEATRALAYGHLAVDDLTGLAAVAASKKRRAGVAAAVRIAGDKGHPLGPYLPMLAGWLDDGDEFVRWSAACALRVARRAGFDVSATRDRLATLAAADPEARVREAAAAVFS